ASTMLRELSDRDGTVLVAGQVEEEAVERAREEYLEGAEQENSGSRLPRGIGRSSGLLAVFHGRPSASVVGPLFREKIMKPTGAKGQLGRHAWFSRLPPASPRRIRSRPAFSRRVNSLIPTEPIASRFSV